MICMSTYSGEKFLDKQITSIINQDYQNWMLLIHDDGSSDNTLSIIKKYAALDSRIKFVGQHHLGVKKSFFELLRLKEADLYAFCDQDDIWIETKLSKLVATVELENPSNSLLVHSAFQNIDAQDHKLPDFKLNKNVSTEFKDLLFSNNVTGCTCMINLKLRNEVLSVYDQLDESQVFMHDWWLAIVASGIGKIVYLEDRLVLYRQHNSNVLGAPGRTNKIKRLLEAARFGDSELIAMVSKQAKLMLTLYGNQLSFTNKEICSFVASLLMKWSPLKIRQKMRRYSLKSRSKYRNIELSVIIWLPIAWRPKVLRNFD